MYRYTKCPKCMKENALPMTVKIGNNGITHEFNECSNCNEHFTPKKYFEMIASNQFIFKDREEN